MTEKLQLRLHGVNTCDGAPSSCDARLIEKLRGGFRARVKFTPRRPNMYSAPGIDLRTQNVVFLLYESEINFTKLEKKKTWPAFPSQ